MLEFVFNLMPLIYIIPSDVLPITHVLYVHNRIYDRVKTSTEIIFNKNKIDIVNKKQDISEDN